MGKTNHTAALNELSASEGVFTTAQAARLGIPRNVLSQAVLSGRAERIAHGAYKLSGTPDGFIDELAAIWKLTDPSAFTYERLSSEAMGGIVVGGATAACLLGIGDFHLSPYRVYSPRRINSRIEAASFATSEIDPSDVTIVEGLPVTRPERTLVDLCLDFEDPSLIEDAFRDAMAKGLDVGRIRAILDNQSNGKRVRSALSTIENLLSEAEKEAERGRHDPGRSGRCRQHQRVHRARIRAGQAHAQ